jgi:hypothetical protein
VITKTERHAEICALLNDIYRRKNADYGDSFGETFRKLGVISAVTRITDKISRLQTLCVKPAQVRSESVRDTLLDLANYAIMTTIELELDNTNNKETEETNEEILGLDQERR